MKKQYLYSFLFLLTLLLSCGGSDTPGPKPLSIISATINGANLSASNQEVLIEAQVVFVFSAATNPDKFMNAFSWTSPTGGEVEYSITFSNASSKVTIDALLDYSTPYTISLAHQTIGEKGGRLTSALSYPFKTAADDVIRSMPPCTSASADCLQTMDITGSEGTAHFNFYSNYPILEENAAWENLKNAIIVVHGVTRNANDYFSYMTSTLNTENLKDETILISPFFKTSAEADAGDYYWSANGWRDGLNSVGTEKISSFAVLDAMIEQLSDHERFPVLEKIIVTGHSSGALFTQLYAAANTTELTHTAFEYSYIVANSQYFYYPDDNRIDESTSQLFTPDNCISYNIWPMGYNAIPPYLTSVNQTTFNNQFLNRSITYLLGNGSGADPTLNTTDCSATLLGSTRYIRGENMFSYLNLTFPGTHNHAKVIVNGIGHDGQGMYQSSEFKSLLSDLLNN